MTSALLLGLLIGLRHALEADHVAAVATLALRSRSIGRSIRDGAVWGLGHTLTLLAVGSCVLLAGTSVPPNVAGILEASVGAMLIALGIDVMRRLLRDRVHFHVHRHADGVEHFHAHSHRDEPRSAHDAAAHRHPHDRGFPRRALFIGLMHGLAGSAALIVLALGAVQSLWLGLLYMALFGLGSTLGMALLSTVIAVPLRWSGRRFTGFHRIAQGLVSVANLSIGALLIYDALQVPG